MTSSATCLPFRVTRIVPLCRETNPARARPAAASASRTAGHLGERDALAAAGREHEALAGGRLRVERLLGARRLRAGGERRRPRLRARRVAPAPGADGAHGARPEAEVGPGAPVRHVVARLAPRQGEVADLVPVVAGARELAHDAPVARGAHVVHRVGGHGVGIEGAGRREAAAASAVPSTTSSSYHETWSGRSASTAAMSRGQQLRRLAGDAVDQVEAGVGDAGVAQAAEGLGRVRLRRAAEHGAQLRREALRAERDAHSGRSGSRAARPASRRAGWPPSRRTRRRRPPGWSRR